MSIVAAQMQLRRRWLSMMMQRRGGAVAAGSPFSGFETPSVPRCFATATQKFLADTHFLSNEEIKKNEIGEAKRPPGAGPGEFLHQRKHFPKELFTSREMMPVYPLLFMVFTAFVMAVVTMYRELAEHPTLVVKKKERREHPVPELDEREGVTMVEKARDFYNRSPFRRVAFGPEWIKEVNAKFFHQPPKLPGGDKLRETEPAEPVHS
ncbi:hypothetical protein GOP47_0028627 [Adiantum capillus-veneris]|nr:hypothetical protein GOP47_0028627 [Adiantum capillus-veneris]